MNRYRILSFTRGALALGLVVCTASGSASAQPDAASAERDGPRARALCIGLNWLNPASWHNWDGRLHGCLNDMSAMTTMLSGAGFTVTPLADDAATRTAVLTHIRSIGAECEEGDLFVITYAGHGGQVEDLNGDEDDRLDETWCLWDGHLIDDYLREAIASIAPGVRVLVISDSCYSGTVIRLAAEDLSATAIPLHAIEEERNALQELEAKWRGADEQEGAESPRIRAISLEHAWLAYNSNREEYEELGRNAPGREEQVPRASVLLLSGCQDTETSVEYEGHGLFTRCLLEVWADGAFVGDYEQFHSRVQDLTNSHRQRMPPYDQQRPNYLLDGQAHPTFPAQERPFDIGG